MKICSIYALVKNIIFLPVMNLMMVMMNDALEMENNLDGTKGVTLEDRKSLCLM